VTTSARASSRITAARERQRFRLAASASACSCNGEMSVALVRRHVNLDTAAEEALARAYTSGSLSARGRHRVLRVAQTVADLAGHDRVTLGDMLTALGLRQRSGAEMELAA
jgi:magnesium chelatase family protein